MGTGDERGSPRPNTDLSRSLLMSLTVAKRHLQRVPAMGSGPIRVTLRQMRYID
jgi:hypothetical protein